MAERQRSPLNGTDEPTGPKPDQAQSSVHELDQRVREKTFELAVAEEALEAERQNLLNLLDQFPHFVCLLARDFSIRFVNQRFRNLFGRNQGERCFERIHGQAKPCADCALGDVLAKRTPIVREWRSPEGRVYEICNYPFHEIDGTPRMLKLGIDVTERVQAQQELKVERDRIQNILNSMVDGIYIVNQHNDVLYFNSSLERDFGRPDGRKCYSYLHDRHRPCPWCGYPQAVDGKVERREWHSERSNKTYDLLGTAIKNADGTLSRLQIIHDITDRKRIEDSLRASEERYRMLVAAMNEGLGAADERGIVTFVNDHLCTMLGFRKEELIGRSVEDFLDEKNRRALSERREARDSGEDRPYELTWTRKDGKKVPTIVSPRTVRTDNRITGSIAVITDITERLKAEAAMKDSARQLQSLSVRLLRAQEEERGRVSRELHDELGQSLSVLKLRVGLIRKQLHPDQLTAKQDCDETLQYLNQVIENVRRLSRDLSPAILADLGLSTALRRLLTQFSQLASCEVDWHVGDIDKLLSEDSEIILYRIFQEALTNIQKHSQANKVSVALEKQDDIISCVIADDGIGFSLRRTDRPDPTKSGMGLAIMAERVRMLGGALNIQSEPDKGTRITFSFPIQAAGAR